MVMLLLLVALRVAPMSGFRASLHRWLVWALSSSLSLSLFLVVLVLI